VDIAAAAAAAKPIEPFLPRHISERRTGGLMRAISRGQGLPTDHLPKPLRRICRRPSEGEKRRFAEIQKHRDASATALGIDPTLIASRAMLSDLAYDWDKHAGQLMNWQRGLLQG
jgi:ribonuclease D